MRARLTSQVTASPDLPSSRSILIEFIGAPGSGKTRLACDVLSLLAGDGVRVTDASSLEQFVQSRYVGRSTTGTALRWARALGGDPSWARAILMAAKAASWRLSAVRRLVRVTHRIKATALVRDSPGMLWVPDEWILHELILALVEVRDANGATLDSLVDAVMLRLGCGVIVVRCVVDPKIAAARVQERRGASEYDGRGIPELVPILERIAEVANSVARRIAPQVEQVITVDTSADPVASAFALKNTLMAALASERGIMFGLTHTSTSERR